VRVPQDIVDEIDARVKVGEYHTRSAAVRDALRDAFAGEGATSGGDQE